MSKKLFFGSNLKMYKNIKDTVSYLQELESLTKDISRDEIELFIRRTKYVLGGTGTVYRRDFSSDVTGGWHRTCHDRTL